MISVIIPAHNESAVIGRCLRALTNGAVPGQLEVIVVANGCTDDTAAVATAAARNFGAGVKVVETPIGSKILALNLGDEAATGFPRFYVDADVVLTRAAVEQLAARLDAGSSGVLAVAPRPRFAVDRASWVVRAFYEVND